MRHLGAIVLLVTACGPPGYASTSLSGGGGGGSTGTTEVTSADASTSDSPTTTTPTDPSTSAASTSSTGELPSADLGVPDLGGDGPPAGCEGKIDFLFVIGRDVDMASKQEALLASLPGFVTTIEDAFADFDYHILFANPQDWWGSYWACKPANGNCPSDGGCAAIDEPSYPCWAHYTPGTLTDCDWQLGAGITFPAGQGASNVPCKFTEGRRYLQKGDANLAGTFECAARGGYSGSGIYHGWATVQAVSEELSGPGGCNEGFLRDDALLVIVWITDWGDISSPFSPLGWAQLVQGAKGDDQDGIVILALLDDAFEPEPQYCKTEAGGYDRLGEMLSYFDHTLRGSVCMPDYTDFFAEGAELVLDICDVYVPQ